MIWLARKLTFYNKTRLIITVIGVVFSIYLTLTEIALYVGMMENATSIIRNSKADIWIASKGIQNFDFAKVFPDRHVRDAIKSESIAAVAPLLINWGFIKLRNGSQELVEIIGYDPSLNYGGPWSLANGEALTSTSNNNIILDQSSEQRLGPIELGSQWELNDELVTVEGVSDGARTFTTAPIVFSSYKYVLTHMMSKVSENNVSYILIKCRNDSDIPLIKSILVKKLPNNDVLTTEEFVWRTVGYWTIQTGMGAAFCLTAFLGLVVGAGIIGQTVYANTLEHIGELATLKAMGASSSELNSIILIHSAINIIIGFLIALPLTFACKIPLEKLGVSLALEPKLIGGLFVVIFLTAIGSAYFSIARVRDTDPAIIFRS
jgi:putative ABC transport system permease protein